MFLLKPNSHGFLPTDIIPIFHHPFIDYKVSKDDKCHLVSGVCTTGDFLKTGVKLTENC